MIGSVNGKFNNTLEGHIVISEYTGSFDQTGIKAIVADVLAHASHLELWCWHQKPHSEAGISPAGMAELTARYQSLHLHGCCAIGVSYTNVLINAVDLPHDGSIQVPIKVAKDEHILMQFFNEAMNVAGRADKTNAMGAMASQAKHFDIINDFLAAAQLVSMSDAEIRRITGSHPSSLHAHAQMYNTEKCTHIQGVTALINAMSFKLNAEKGPLEQWFRTELSDLSQSPVSLCTSKVGLEQLLQRLP
ncbi:hypothetical protein [Alteromonas flava]|uniref:hypothetical protein n=1 Tax=Alteromonas flava TaxID=2048003 RepID=UPI000C28F160|nr:hypothetical protein [Alteromonas flava]